MISGREKDFYKKGGRERLGPKERVILWKGVNNQSEPQRLKGNGGEERGART